MRRRAVSLGALLALAMAATALAGEEPTLEVRLQPQRFGIEDAAHLVITVSGGRVTGEPPRPRQLKNLQIVGGPSTEQQFSWVNGVASSSTRFTYILQGIHVGPASVGPIEVTVGGKRLSSEPITAIVVNGSVAPPSRRVRGMPMDPFDELFGQRAQRATRVGLKLLVPKKKLWDGEPMLVSVVLDTTAAVDGFEWVRAPSFPGWWAQRVDLPKQVSGSAVQRDGVVYRRFPVARYVLIPLKPGKLSIPPIRARIGLRSFSVFGPGNVVERETPRADFEIVPRPTPPAGFSGAVGALRYRAELKPAVIPLGGSATLTVTLRGSGNLPLVQPPAEWPACTNCDTYPPEESSKVKVDNRGLHGSRSWQMTLVPRRAGTIRLAPVHLAVFDPATGTYEDQVLGPFVLAVRGPTPTPAPTPTIVSRVGAGPISTTQHRRTLPAPPANRGFPWAIVLAAVGVGLLAGVLFSVLLVRSRRRALPPPRAGQSAADRARELQGVLERWWLGVPERKRKPQLEARVEELRRRLEMVRFAPGRADHSETVVELERELRSLLRRA